MIEALKGSLGGGWFIGGRISSLMELSTMSLLQEAIKQYTPTLLQFPSFPSPALISGTHCDPTVLILPHDGQPCFNSASPTYSFRLPDCHRNILRVLSAGER